MGKKNLKPGKKKKIDEGKVDYSKLPDLLRFQISTDPSMPIADYDTLLSKAVLLGVQVDERLARAEELLLYCHRNHPGPDDTIWDAIGEYFFPEGLADYVG